MEKVSLTDFLGGAAIEAFDYEMSRVAENILDPNTLATSPREITLKVTIKPTADREMGSVDFHCTTKIAPTKPLNTRIFFSLENGHAIAIEHDPKQMKLPETEEPAKLKAVGGKKE
jgi:hypothetical protein